MQLDQAVLHARDPALRADIAASTGQLEAYRVLNLLYYTTPGWQPAYGGHLQVWDRGMRHPARTLHSSFNRLVLMATTPSSCCTRAMACTTSRTPGSSCTACSS